MERKTILTGDRPTGKLHLGHYAGSLRNRVELQNSGKYDMYVFIADMQALTDNAKNPQKIRDNIIEVALDYLSVGLDPEKTCIFVQSQIPALSELTMYYMNLVSLARLKRNPTIKSEIKERGFGETIPVGFLTYPISQAADITAFDADLVPVGEDQAPILEQDIEIVRTFNSIYGKTLKEPKQLTPENVCKRLPGIDGKNKMSKSLGNCIYLSDSEEELREKVRSMYTDPDHIKVSDPGKVEGNVVFTYLDAFADSESFKKYCNDYESLDELKKAYQKGGVGDMYIKKILFNILNEFLTPIRTRRLEYQKDMDNVMEILKKGTEEARSVAKENLIKFKKALRIDYFD